MTSKHTPGPWKQSKADETLVVSSTHDDVAHVYGDYETEYERMAADACLIAAAPELLEALKVSIRVLESLADAGKLPVGIEAFRIGHIAIAKAEGR